MGVEDFPTNPQEGQKTQKEAPEQKTERLESELEQARLKYAGLGLDRKKKKGGTESENEFLESQSCYQEALRELKEAEVEKMKEQGLEGEEFEKKTAEVLTRFSFEETNRFFDAKTEIKTKKSKEGNWIKRKWGKTKQWLKDNVGDNPYFVWGQAGGGVGVGIAMGSVVGGSIVAIPGKILATKKCWEDYSDFQKEREVVEKTEGYFKKVEDEPEKRFDSLNSLLDSEIDSLEEKIEDAKTEKRWIKAGSAIMGMVPAGGELGLLYAALQRRKEKKKLEKAKEESRVKY